MPHSNGQHHPKGEGVKLVAIPMELIDLMIPGNEDRKRALSQVDNEGPEQKQVFSALLLNRLHKMLHAVEENSGTKFSLQEGYEINQQHDGRAATLPVAIPIMVSNDLGKKQIADVLAHAPEHEALVYAMCLQAIEWTIKTIGKYPASKAPVLPNK